MIKMKNEKYLKYVCHNHSMSYAELYEKREDFGLSHSLRSALFQIVKKERKLKHSQDK
jgi:hypothetical protein